jgi:hypothetical protein
MPQNPLLSQLRERRDESLVRAIAAEEQVRALDRAIAEAARGGRGRELELLREQRDEAADTAKAARGVHAETKGRAFAGLEELLSLSQEAIVGTLVDQHPIVLLPVRVETKYARVGQGVELRVRLFPDDISVAAPPSALTEDERAAGEGYWKARAASREQPADAELRSAYEVSWTTLATRSGAYRASYVAAATRPTEPDVAPAALEFKTPVAPTEPPLARADLLPDRFVILTYAEATKIDEITGSPIPDDLVLIPDALQSDSWLERDTSTGRIIVPPALEWLTDFDAAVKVGMAVRIPLKAPYDTQGYSRVVAIGVRSATPPEAGPASLERLLAKHRYGDGCGIARAGMPTNNTDTAKAGWQPPSGDVGQLFKIEDAPPDITPRPGMRGVSDGWRLAELFGLSTEFARRLPNAEATDVAEALAMNHAAAPGTLDDYVREFLQTVVTPSAAAALHAFFVRWVSGRGHYPALRIGREPYGIVVTSAWGLWTYSQTQTGRRFAGDVSPVLAGLIRKHRPKWDALGRAAAHAAQPAANPFARLLAIIGLLASSSDFVSRKAVPDEYVKARLLPGSASHDDIQAWFDELKSSRDSSLNATGFPPLVGKGPNPKLAFVTFLDHTDGWRLPIVDRDPGVPLSESEGIAKFDQKRNYLHWLSEASRSDISVQRFTDADSKPVAPPNALMYVVLRHALLSALQEGTLEAARTFGGGLFEVVEQDPVIANVGAAQHVLRKDYLQVDASKLGLTAKPTALVDWALESARAVGAKPAGTAVLADVQSALAALVDVPTAGLERLFTEHVDLCSYRLDAWITALYSERLAQLQSRQQRPGLYLGAYGWVENLRPANGRRAVPADTLPAALRPAAGRRVFEDAANGGFVHAPSLTQAASASVLRNAYLSHASAELPTPFAVNLSSARMRTAMAIMEGVRNGQPIAALLGYQVERGLHERHGGLELDQYIYALRDMFPLVAGQLTDTPPGVSAEVIEARNVVNGAALVNFTAGKPFSSWGIAGMPPQASREASAIVEEVERARDALDAVSDLLLSESVHQAVQGNVARTRASLQALTDPEAPPEPEVIRTQRGGTVVTFRVALALDVDSVSGWFPALTPRALSNAQLNHWLRDRLPPPSDVRWSVRNGAGAATTESLASAGLEPIDVVLMSGDRLGDQSGLLERFLIRRFRSGQKVPDERLSVVAPAAGPPGVSTVLFDFSASGGGKHSLAAIQPLLARLRRMITKARGADARDFWRNADTPRMDAGDPAGSGTGDPRLAATYTDLTDRLDAAAKALTDGVAAINASLLTLAPLRAALETTPATVSNPAWEPALEGLRRAMFDVVPLGLAEALPADGITVGRTLIDTLIAQGQAVVKLIEQRLTRAAPLRATTFGDPLPAAEPALSRELAKRNDVLRRNYVEAARELFGPEFVVVPLFHLHADQQSELAQALGTPVTTDALAAEAWLHSASRVRPRLAELTWSMAASRWLERPIGDPAVVQLPHIPKAPWVGGKIGTALPRGEWLSLTVFGSSFATKPLQAALMVDDWTETIPADRETTGVSFNFNRPNAVAPHAVLVAVPPVLRGHWEWEDLVGSVNEALNLAKVRAVEVDQLIDREAGETSPHGDYFQSLPAILSEFTGEQFAHVNYALAVTPAKP